MAFYKLSDFLIGSAYAGHKTVTVLSVLPLYWEEEENGSPSLEV